MSYSAGTQSVDQKYWWNNGTRTATGTVIGNFLNEALGVSAQNEYAAAEAQKARDFEERMSSTAYQRAAADMKAAGINPATLTGMSGSGSAASTPSGSAAASSSGNAAGVIGSIFRGLLGIISKPTSTTNVTKNFSYHYH